MHEKSRSKTIITPRLSRMTLFYSLCICSAMALAQGNERLNNDIYKHQVLQTIDSLLEAKYVIPEKATEYARKFRATYESGIYDTLTNSSLFAKHVTADLRHITGDQHILFRVIESSGIGEDHRSALHHPIRYHVLGINENKGFSRLEWLEGNIGYLDIRRFYTIGDVKDRVLGAMTFLSGANAIIIDLRENGGGSGDYLSSYFLPYPMQLNNWYSREEDFLTEFWTSKDTGMEPLTDVPLFVLTSKRTFSASESFAYDMKVRKRAVIVGDSTRGGAHSVDLYKIDDQFEIYISTERAINPVTGTNWEGIGVIPDILVTSEAALDTAIVLARKAGAEFGGLREARLKLAVDDMEVFLARAETCFLNRNTEDAQAALDSFFKIAEDQKLVNEFFIDVLAYNYLAKKDEEMRYAVLKKKIAYFPESPAGYQSLGYAYYKNDKKDLAIACFKSVLELEPDNRNAMNMLDRMQSK